MININYDFMLCIWIGVVIGYWVAVVMERRMMRQSLQLSAMGGTPQKIGDDFYYIVPEERHVQMQIDALKAQRFQR